MKRTALSTRFFNHIYKLRLLSTRNTVLIQCLNIILESKFLVFSETKTIFILIT